MRRITAVLLVAAGAAGIALAPASEQAAPPDGGTARPVESVVLACPALAVSGDSASTAAGLVVPDAAVADGAGADGAGAGQGAGSAALRILGSDRDLARLSAPGVPVALLVADRSQPPILLEGSGGWAPSAVAGVASNDLGGAGSGLSSAACPPPGPQWWFVGSGSQLGRGAALLVSNPASEPARIDVEVTGRSGPVETLAGTGIDLAPQSHLRLRLDALVDPQDLLAVHVRATAGRVGAALRDVAVPRGQSPRGVDFIPPALPPTTELAIGGIPGGSGDRDLVLVNPGTQFATVTPALVTEAGTGPLPGLERIAVPAGSVISLPLAARLGRAPASLLLRSDVPVTGGVRVSVGTTTRDLAWLSAVPPVAAPNAMAAAAAVPAGRGLGTTVTVLAPAGEVAGVLWVDRTGRAPASVFSGDGALARGRLAPSPDPGGGPQVLTGGDSAPVRIPVLVPAGSQRSIELPALEAGALAHVAWRSDPGSGPAALSHMTRGAGAPRITGYSWWPTISAVVGAPVREDVGTLAPVG